MQSKGDNSEYVFETAEKAFDSDTQVVVLTPHPSRSTWNITPKDRTKTKRPSQSDNQSSLNSGFLWFILYPPTNIYFKYRCYQIPLLRVLFRAILWFLPTQSFRSGQLQAEQFYRLVESKNPCCQS